jgi:UDP-2,3-diacylglucosamine hydrolase
VTTTVPRFEELLAPSHWRTVDFISDLHLHQGDAATVATWQRYLHSTPADAVFMLGDMFEVWVGDDALAEPGSFEAQCAAVLQSAAQQRALFFMVGNRDFLIGSAFARRSSTRLVADPTVLQWAGQRWLLSHGDALCLEDVDYQRFRAAGAQCRMATAVSGPSTGPTAHSSAPDAPRKPSAQAIRGHLC